MTASALYEGWVAHTRMVAPRRSFRYPIWMALLDLDELPGAFDAHPLWSARRPAPVRIRRRDFLGPPKLPLADAARERVAAELGRAPQGPVRLLAMPRVFGIGFNPVTFLYLHEPDGRLGAVVAEVTNTPWGDRHAYVLEAGPEGVHATVAKRMHVSPFMPPDQDYEVSMGPPGDRLTARITNRERSRAVHVAALTLSRRALVRREMSRLITSYPPTAAAALGRIYGNALRLVLGGARRYPRLARDPDGGRESAQLASAGRPRPAAARPRPARATRSGCARRPGRRCRT